MPEITTEHFMQPQTPISTYSENLPSYFVHRNERDASGNLTGNKFLEGGWYAANTYVDDGGLQVVTMVKPDTEGTGGIEKTISLEAFDYAQSEGAKNVGSLSLSQGVEVEMNPVEDEGVSADLYDKLFDPNYDMESLSVEEAAVNIPDLFKMINSHEADGFGQKRLTPEEVSVVGEGLSALGITTEQPTKEQLESMHALAVNRVNSGAAEGYLRSLPFKPISEMHAMKDSAKRSVVTWSSDNPIYIDPIAIESGGSDFLNWAGDSHNRAKSRTTAEGKSVNGSTFEAIKEYAANFDTQIPETDTNGLNIIVGNDGVHCFVSHGVHRVAAAKLRGEPIRFSSMVFYDAR